MISRLFSTSFALRQARRNLKYGQLNHVSFTSHTILLCDNKRKKYLLQSCRRSPNHHCPDADSLILFTIGNTIKSNLFVWTEFQLHVSFYCERMLNFLLFLSPFTKALSPHFMEHEDWKRDETRTKTRVVQMLKALQ